MKILKSIGAAVMAVLVCANFASCSKDAVDGNPSVDGDPFSTVKEYASEKKLTKIVSEYSSYGKTQTQTTAFKYDSDGRLVESVQEGESSNNEEWSGVAEYKWTNTAISYKEKYVYKDGHMNIPNTYECRYEVSKGLVREMDYAGDDVESVSYNKDGRYDGEETWEWDGDKLMCTYSDYMSVYTYGEPCKSGYYPFCSIDSSALFYAHPELLGVRTKQLPVSCRSTAYYVQDLKPYSSTYEYEFDAEGYVIKQKTTEVHEDGYTRVYIDSYTWE